MDKIKILIADNQTLIKEGIRSLLKGYHDFEIVGEANSSFELLPAIKNTAPDIVLIDFQLPGFFCLEDIKRIYRENSDTNILVVTTNQVKADILKALEYGINNYILKLCDIFEFIGALYATARKERFFCGKVLDAILDESGSEPNNCEPLELSAREAEVVKLIAQGFTNQIIAEKLFLSIHTVGTHRKNILRKLNINKSSELVMYAVRNGMVSAGGLTS